MSSHPVVRRVRRLMAAALLLVLAAAPALAAPGSTRANRPHSPRIPVTTGVPMLDRLLDWLGLPAAGVPDPIPARPEKGGLLPLIPGQPPFPSQNGTDNGPMVDPNG